MIPGPIAAERNRALRQDAELRRIERAIRRTRERPPTHPRWDGDRSWISMVLPKVERRLGPPGDLAGSCGPA
jgi:hypothetical protein